MHRNSFVLFKQSLIARLRAVKSNQSNRFHSNITNGRDDQFTIDYETNEKIH